MKKLFTILLATMVAQTSFSQGFTADFENLTFPTGKNYWKGNPGIVGETEFSTGNSTELIHLINKNDTSSFGDYWSGWAYSKGKDTISIAYDSSDCNAFFPIDTSSNTYAVAYQSWNDYLNRIRIQHQQFGVRISSFKITNSTIAFRSMQNGDGIAKKFGGPTGNDPDYFKVRFFGWKIGVPLNDTFDFYLADFRDTNNANDFIVDKWTTINIPFDMNDADSLSYTLESSDVGGFGMNTPAYFCVDDFKFYAWASVTDLSQNSLIKIYPNPINNEFQIANNSSELLKFSIMNLNGQIIYTDELIGNNSMKIISINWSKGVYMMKIQQGQNQFYQKIIK